jgi:hypothetical protein
MVVGGEDYLHFELTDFVLAPCLAAVRSLAARVMDSLRHDLLSLELASDLQRIHAVSNALVLFILEHLRGVFAGAASSVGRGLETEHGLGRLSLPLQISPPSRLSSV